MKEMKCTHYIPILLLFLLAGMGLPNPVIGQTVINFNAMPDEGGYGQTFGDDHIPHEVGHPSEADMAGGFLFTVHGPASSNNLIVRGALSGGDQDGSCLTDGNTLDNGITSWRIKKADNSAFRFIGVFLRQYYSGSSDDIDVKAYKAGSQIGATVTVRIDEEGDTFSDFAANPHFYDVDEIRLEATDINFFLDNFVHAPPFSIGSNDPAAVLNISLQGQPLTTATSVTYIVAFSKEVTNVDVSDFELTRVGTTTGTLGTLTGSGDTYQVTITGIGGEGSLRLDLKSGTDITTVTGNISGTSAYTGGQTHYVGSCFTETFDQGEINNATTFSGNGVNFGLQGGWTVRYFALNRGLNGSDFHLTGIGAGTYKMTPNAPISIKGLYLYLSNLASGDDPGASGTVTLTGKRNNVTQYTITKNSNFNTTATNSGYNYIDFTTNGDVIVDELEITIGGGFVYLDLDNLNWCFDFTPPSGYSVQFDQNNIDGNNHEVVSFTSSGAEIGATYHYSISSSAGGTPVTGTGVISSANQQMSSIDVSGLPVGTLTLSFYLTDASNNQGSPVTHQAIYTLNLPPVTTNLHGDSFVFTEGGNATLIDVGGNAVVTDIDSPDFGAGNLTVSITSNGENTDVLGIRNQGVDAGQIGVSGLNVTYGGVLIGSYTGGSNGTNLVVTFNNAANPANVSTLLRNLTFQNTSNDPSTASRNISVTIADGDGGTSTAAEITAVVTAVNNAPTLSATALNPTFTEGDATVALFSGANSSTIENGQKFTQLVLTASGVVDAANHEYLRIGTGDSHYTFGITSTPTNGITKTKDPVSGVITVTIDFPTPVTAAELNSWVNNFGYIHYGANPTPSPRVFTLTALQDDGGTANGGVDTRALSIVSTVTVVAVNDAPIITAPATIAVVEDVQTPLTGISFSDVDAGAAAVTATFSVPSGSLSAVSGSDVTVGGTASAVTLTGTIADINAFVASGNVAFTTAMNATVDVTLTVSINDNGNTGTGGSLSDSGTITLLVTAVNDAPVITAPATIAVDEDVQSQLMGISFSDVDAGAAAVTATFSVPSGSLSASSGSGVTIGGTTNAMTLSGAIANINTFIASGAVRFTTAMNATADVTLTVSINDNGNTGTGGDQTDTKTVTLSVTAINDPPVITAPATIAVVEDVQTPLTGISFSDVDAGAAAVTVTLSVPSGSLSAVSVSGVTVGGTASAATLTGTIADINTFVASGNIAFTTAMNATANVTLTVSINDNGNTGTGGSLSDSGTITLLVTAVNDAPELTAPTTQTIDQDETLIFHTADNNHIVVSDVDAGTSAIQLTLTAANGSLTLAGTTGLSFLVGGGANDAAMTFEGTLADINNALDGLQFKPTAGYNGPASLSIAVNDKGASGSGGVLTDTKVISITVNPLNPTITGVSSSTADGLYGIGQTINIAVTFDQNVYVHGTDGRPTLLLETGLTDRNAIYDSGSGSKTLIFKYIVQEGDLSVDLDYQSAVALMLNGFTVRNNIGKDAILILPSPAAAGSLGASKNIVIDGVRPVITLDIDGGALYTNNSNVTLTVNTTDTDIATMHFSNDGTDYSAAEAFATNKTWELTSGDGLKTVYTQVVDHAGNASVVVQKSITLDQNSPIVTGVSDGGIYNDNRTITFNEGNATLNGASFHNGTVVSAEDSYTLVVTDPANNVTTVSFEIDKTVPVVTGVSDGESYNNDRTITFNEGNATLNGASFHNGTVVSAEGSYTLVVTDPAGNVTTVSFEIDKTVPVVTGVSDGGIYNDDRTVTFNEGNATLNGASFNSGDVVSAEGSYTLVVTDAADNVTTVSFEIDKTVPVVTGVSDGESYNNDRTITFNEGNATLNGASFTNGDIVSAEDSYTFVVTDPAGNVTTVSFEIDKTVPVVTGVSDGGIYNDDRTVMFNEGNATLNGTSFNSGNIVSAEGNYTLFVTDPAGNVTTVSFEIDKTVPVVTGVSDGGIYNDDRTVTFNEGNATLNGTSFNSGDIVSAEGSYTLVVTDPAGNVKTVGFAIDKTAPATPFGLTASPSAGNISLQWSANQEADLAAYHIYAGTLANQLSLLTVIPTGTTIHIDGPLTIGQRYYYAISAVDALGNESPQSAVVDAMPQDIQTITFDALADRTFGDEPFALTATASSGLSITYSSSDNNIASISGNLLTIHQVGDVEITASQNGNDAFLAAAPVTQSLHIHKATLSGVAIGDAVHTYDGTVKSLEISGTLPNGVTVSYDNNEQVNAGTYIVTANIDGGTNYEDQTLSATLTIEKADLTGITLTGDTHTYDGTAKSLTIAGTLPNGVTVSYDNNGQVNAGTYIVTANIDGGTNYEDQTLSATMTIEKADLTGITLTDATHTYDGTAKSLTIAGTLPNGVTVSYDNNGQVNAGTYIVTANIDGGTNYEDQTLSATLTIEKADLTGITLTDATYTYDGTAKSLAVAGTLPAGVTVTYANNGQVNAGAYTVTANMDGGTNFEDQTLTAELTIEKAVITGITLEDATYTYDGTAKSLAVVGTLSNGVTVSYTNNGQVNAGTYIVTANIDGGTNYEGQTLTATLTIEKADLTAITLTDATYTYDGTAKSLTIAGTLPNGIVVVYDNNGQIDVGEYTVTATIAETENHTGLRLQALLTIRKASQTITFTSPGTLARDAGSVALDVRSDSDLPVVLSVDDDMVARINGTNLEVLRLGTVVITATQVGSENYEAAEPVSVTVRVANDANAPLPIRVHQAVSPNGDGINEFLIMEGIRDYPENKVTIFDKSGKVIEVIEGYNNGDRVFTAQFVNDGTYYYYIDVKDGGVWKREKGFFVVKRSVN